MLRASRAAIYCIPDDTKAAPHSRPGDNIKTLCRASCHRDANSLVRSLEPKTNIIHCLKIGGWPHISHPKKKNVHEATRCLPKISERHNKPGCAHARYMLFARPSPDFSQHLRLISAHPVSRPRRKVLYDNLDRWCTLQHARFAKQPHSWVQEQESAAVARA